MKTKVEFSFWGNKTDTIRLPQYAMRDEYESKLEAVVRACKSKSGLICCGGPRSEGTSLNNNVPESQHYAFTLGYPCGGGCSPVAEVWVSIPIDQ